MKRDYIRPAMLLVRVETKGRVLTLSEKNVTYDPTDGTTEALSRENRWGGNGTMRRSNNLWNEMGE